MPGLVLFQRKWLVAGDLLLFPFSIETVLRAVWTATTSYMLWLHYQADYSCVYGHYTRCYLFILLLDLILNVPLCGLMTWLSAQGSVMEEGKRAYLPTALYVKVALFSVDSFIAITGTWLGFFNEDLCVCIPPDIVAFIEVTSVCFLLYFSTIAAVISITYNPLGSLKFWREDETYNMNKNIAMKFFRKAEKIWALRLKCVFCCLGVGGNNDSSIYREIATFFASFFENRDLYLIPSDVLTGLIIISKRHASEKKRLKFMDSLCSYEYINSSDPSVPSWMNVENALYYFRFAKYTYGWPLLASISPCKLLSSASRRCFGCRIGVSGSDDCCDCNITALKKVTGFTNEELLYASYRNAIYEPAFFVAVDKRVMSVIIGIRGTFSVSDIITDVDAENERVRIDESVQNFYCHRGVLRSAAYIYNKLNELDILKSVLTDYPDYNLVITGHSLGGSIASVVGLLLRPHYPNVQCYAYGPLAALSLSGIKTTYDFVFTVVVGDDAAPRLSVTSCEELRVDIINSLKECTTPKYKIMLQALARLLFKRKIFKSAGEVEKANHFFSNGKEDSSEKDGSSLRNNEPRDTRLYAPGRILYLEKTPNGARSLWKTGFHFQRLIISPYMLHDHQPRTIQNLLNEVIQLEKSLRRQAKMQFLEGPSDSIDEHVVYSQSVDLSDEGIDL